MLLTKLRKNVNKSLQNKEKRRKFSHFRLFSYRKLCCVFLLRNDIIYYQYRGSYIKRMSYHLNVRSGVVVVLAGQCSTACNVAKHFAPTTVVVKIFLKIVVMIVGVKDISLVEINNLVAVLVLAGVNESCSTSCDGVTVVVIGDFVAGITVCAYSKQSPERPL